MSQTNNKKTAITPPGLMAAIATQLLVRRFGTLLLVTVTIVSAFFMVVLTHEKRQLFAELEYLNKERDQLDVEWRQLRLEQRVLGEHSRLEEVAKEDLGMKALDLKSERIIKQVKDGE